MTRVLSHVPRVTVHIGKPTEPGEIPMSHPMILVSDASRLEKKNVFHKQSLPGSRSPHT